MNDDTDLIFDNTVDNGAWHVTVTDDVLDGNGYRATLRVRDKDDKVVHQEIVGVMFAARFGPDVSDVLAWQDRAIDVIDHPKKRSVTT